MHLAYTSPADKVPESPPLTQVPNHSREYVRTRQGGTFHLSFPTPRGFLLLMEAAGFALGAMSVHADYRGGVAAQGAWIRAAFIKPNPPALRWGLQGITLS